MGKAKGKQLMSRQVQLVEEQYKSASTSYGKQDTQLNYLSLLHVRSLLSNADEQSSISSRYQSLSHSNV